MKQRGWGGACRQELSSQAHPAPQPQHRPCPSRTCLYKSCGHLLQDRRPGPKTKFLPASCQRAGSRPEALLSPRGRGHGQFGMYWCLSYAASCWVPERRPGLAFVPDLAREVVPSVLGENARHQLHSQPLLPPALWPAWPPPPLKRAGLGHPGAGKVPERCPPSDLREHGPACVHACTRVCCVCACE